MKFTLVSMILALLSVNITEKALELSKNEEDYRVFKKNVTKKYETWLADHDGGDVSRFVQEKMIELSANLQDRKSIRNVVFWLAYCREMEVDAPRQVKEALSKYEDQISNVKSWDDLYFQIETLSTGPWLD